jgi:hypothetical protein
MYSHIRILVVSWIPLSPLVVSSPLSTTFLISFYSESLFCVLLDSGACERHTWSLVCDHPIRLSSFFYRWDLFRLSGVGRKCFDIVYSTPLNKIFFQRFYQSIGKYV